MKTGRRTVNVGDLRVGGGHPLVLVAGPCQLETLDHARSLAHRIGEVCERLAIGFIFKASFDKANRTSIVSDRGPGIEEGLEILARVRKEFTCPVLTDVHEPGQCRLVAEVCDVLQIPAFLCRQTDLLIAAGATGRAVNIKKGQFMAPWDMKHVAAKIAHGGNERIMLCERGTSFGYNALVNDFRALPIMAATGYPLMFDATHSVQTPGGLGSASGGQRQFVPHLARAACAVGVDALFLETHENPERAPSDGPNMIPVNDFLTLLQELKAIHDLRRDFSTGS